ncbi:RNA polymerase factor sigma-54 [Chitinimonas sp. BJB300]|uniref:RNA polymerase factor sigma-54 n=1 Tax=Chitinimonas sp. BJB300 TaxID=1559339 RepID=UPI000C10D029|nr:RNA polymerase factor sigma-54 [Chitinimonas sp. BJB300]PHV10146.1 RNA polymerase sigma-54 factor [Chitinimonas sp. BJB300]TSJ86131.1 RNA polymerase factor sigma-54 [Chitinimonas sp. BJB300]
MNAPSFHLEHRQNQVLTPRLQQAVRLLQLSTLDFTQELQQALSTNPFLEMEELEESGVEETADMADGADLFDAESPVDAVTEAPRDDGLDPFPESESWNQAGKDRRDGGEDTLDLLDLAHSEISLQDHLHTQLNVLHLSDRDRLLTALVVEALDDDGYLRVALDELRAVVDTEPAVDESEMQFALKLVQSLDPAGIGARDAQECVRLQLLALPDSKIATQAIRILDEEFKRLVQRDINGLAHVLNCSPAAVEEILACIRRLEPHPGWAFGNHTAAFVTPDIVVRRVDDQWCAMLNPAAVPKIRLNQMYADLFQQHRESHHADLSTHLQEARWTVRNLQQRFSTILRVGQAIVQRQQHFFEHGTLAMQPLGLRDIAEELELHESTVSRATNNKYMATPAGIFELKYFFSRALNTNQGSCCSTTAIRGAIKEMIQSENSQAPLSDAEITRLLTQQGLQVARRTVTKYRQMMHLPSVDMRRQHA